MRTSRQLSALLAAAALAAGIHAAQADEIAALTHEILTMDAAAGAAGSGAAAGRIAADFQSFAGSSRNATALVTGLREGSQITLTQRGHPPATFTPPTQPMGYGNVSTSLSLAQHQLAQQGIAYPTPEQLKVALNGGSIVYGGRTVVYEGVLQMRADGLGWGEIAHSLGTKLGPVVSGIKAQNAGIAAHRARPQAATGAAAAHAPAAAGARGGGAHGAAGGGKGIVDAGGGNAHGMARGKDDAAAGAARDRAAPPGRGIVSAGGQALGPGAAQGAARGHSSAGHGHGGSAAATAAGASAGSTAAGGSGHGKALGHGK